MIITKLLLMIKSEFTLNLLVELYKVGIQYRLIGGQVVFMHDHEALQLLLPRLQVNHLEHLELVVMLVPLQAAASHNFIDFFLAFLGRLSLTVEAVLPGSPRRGGLRIHCDLMENSSFSVFIRTLQIVLQRSLIHAILEMHSAQA